MQFPFLVLVITDPEDDPNNPNAQNPVADNLYPQQQNLIEAQSAGSYPTLDVRHHQHHNLPQSIRSHPIVNYNTGSAITIAGVGVSHSNIAPGYHVNPQRRVLRQSTLPTTLPNNEQNLSGSGSNLENYNSVNLTAPTSPHQMQKGPLYPSAYNSDDIINIETSDCDNYAQQLQQQQQQQAISSGQVTPTHHRLQVSSIEIIQTNTITIRSSSLLGAPTINPTRKSMSTTNVHVNLTESRLQPLTRTLSGRTTLSAVYTSNLIPL